jgi:hypothetical protein
MYIIEKKHNLHEEKKTKSKKFVPTFGQMGYNTVLPRSIAPPFYRQTRLSPKFHTNTPLYCQTQLPPSAKYKLNTVKPV